MKKYFKAALVFVFFTLLWQGTGAVLRRPFFPGPLAALDAMIRMTAEGRLLPHLGTSLLRIFLALAAGMIPAVVLGVAAGRSRRLDSIITPVIYLLHPLPKAAFLPVIMLVFGLGEFSKIFLMAFIIWSQLLVNLRDAAKQVPGELVDSVRSLGAGNAGLLIHVIIPAILPGFFTGLRVSLGTSVAVLFFVETFASQSGLGYLIMDSWTRIAYPEMYAGIMTLSFVGLFLFAILDGLEAIICPWRGK